MWFVENARFENFQKFICIIGIFDRSVQAFCGQILYINSLKTFVKSQMRPRDFYLA